MKNKGFTLIELLIVIGILGALAVGLLAAIDPFEQLKKGRDTSTRNTVSEFYNANLRVYATKGEFIWGTADTWDDERTLLDETMDGYIDQLVYAGELKSQFKDVAGQNRLGRIYVTSPFTDQINVCFQPESKNFRLDPNTIYNELGSQYTGYCTGEADGGANATATDCYWCLQ